MAKVNICKDCLCVNPENLSVCMNCQQGDFDTCDESEINIEKFHRCPECGKLNDFSKLVCWNCKEDLSQAQVLKFSKKDSKQEERKKSDKSNDIGFKKVVVDKDVKKRPKALQESKYETKKAIFIDLGNIFKYYKDFEEMKVPSGQADLFKMTKDDDFYVLKFYRYHIKLKENIFKKICQLSQSKEGLKHLVRISEFGYCERYGRYYEIHEYTPTTLRDWLDKRGKIHYETSKIILQQLAEAIHFLHQNDSCQLLHRDIKPSNILIRKEKDPIDIVLSDFGISSAINSDFARHITDKRGTLMYTAPEGIASLSNTAPERINGVTDNKVIDKVIIGKELDYWGLGMILLEMITGKHPYSNLGEYVIANQLSTKPVPIDEKIPEDWQKIIKGLLTRDYNKRWKFQEVSDWLKGNEDIPVYYENYVEIKTEIPFKFMNKDIHSIGKLAQVIIENPGNWEEGKKRLMRGQISQWIQSEKKEHDLASQIDDIRENKYISVDMALFQTIYIMNPKLPLVFKGNILGSYLPQWNFQPLCRYLQDYYELKDNSSEETQYLIEQFSQENLFSQYLTLVGEKTEKIEMIKNLEDKVEKIEGLSLKAITFLLAINGQEKDFKEKIKNAITKIIFPNCKKSRLAQNIFQNKIEPDGETLIKVKDFVSDKEKNGYSPGELHKKFKSNNFKLYLTEIFKQKKEYSDRNTSFNLKEAGSQSEADEKNKEFFDRFTKDVFHHQLYSQYLIFNQASRDKIKRIKSIENILNNYSHVYEKALVFYVLWFDALEEIKKEIVKKYSQKVILNFKQDQILNQIRDFELFKIQ